MSLLMCNDGAIVSTTSVQFHYIRLSFIELFILFVAFILKRIIICKESYGILNISHHQQKFIVFKALRTDRNYITFCVNAFSIIHKMCCIWIFRLTKRLTDYYDCFSSSSFTIIKYSTTFDDEQFFCLFILRRGSPTLAYSLL